MTVPRAPRIGLVHALRESIAPIEAAFASDWPEAEPISLFDQSLYVDYARAGALTPELTARVADLLRHSAGCGVRAILFTGSLFGAAVEAARLALPVPVLTSYEALIEAALRTGDRLGVVATVADTLALMQADIERHAARLGRDVAVRGSHVAGAVEAVTSGDRAGHDRLVLDALEDLAADGGCDAILLGQFSMAPVVTRLRSDYPLPVLTATGTALARLRELVAD
ncbi:MAG: aspartate/glutamate racemase family protein [Gammaproteobacteria bacterium]|nr:aspartate/glutamate racemase family protein [Gammaproteobacteria bacterium]